MYPNTRIVIAKNGDSKIVGQEKSDLCRKLSDLGKAAGKVMSDKDEDHQPVHQDVNYKQKG